MQSNHNIHLDPNTNKNNTVVITSGDMEENEREVKRRTWFQSLQHLLSYVTLICNSNHDRVIKRQQHYHARRVGLLL